MVHEVVVAIFIATVIPEELTFRGVLLASATSRSGTTGGPRSPRRCCSVCWHISPTLRTMSHDSQLGDTTSSVDALRRRGRGGHDVPDGPGVLLAPPQDSQLALATLARLATNAVAFAHRVDRRAVDAGDVLVVVVVAARCVGSYARDHHAGGCRHTVDEPECCDGTAVGKKPAPRAQNHGVDASERTCRRGRAA